MSLVLGFFICIFIFQCAGAYFELRPYLDGPLRKTVVRSLGVLTLWTLLGLIIPAYLAIQLDTSVALDHLIPSTTALLSFEFLAFMILSLGVSKVVGPGLRLGLILSLAAWLGLVMLQLLLIHQGHAALAAAVGLLALTVATMVLAFELINSPPKSTASAMPARTGQLRVVLGMTAFACFLLLSGLHISTLRLDHWLTRLPAQDYAQLKSLLGAPSPIEPWLPFLFITWLLAKLLLTYLLLRLEKQHLCFLNKHIDEALVAESNQIIAPYQMTAQALFHLPTPILLVSRADQELVYANGLARTLLSDARLTRQPLDAIFLSIVPIGASRTMALFLHPNLSVGLFRLEPIQTPGVSDLSQMLLLHRENLDTTQLGHWLITSRVDSPGSGSCLLNSKFSIQTISKGWESIFSHYDSYFASGLIWDRLRSFTNRVSDVLALEEKVAQEHHVTHLLVDQAGREMKVTVQLLIGPDGSPSYYVIARLTSEANARNQVHRID
ncbi:MAG: hypothetical protein ACO36H_02530 [Burkholderiaceae bacterium]